MRKEGKYTLFETLSLALCGWNLKFKINGSVSCRYKLYAPKVESMELEVIFPSAVMARL